VGVGMNGICSRINYLTHYCSMDSIKALRFILNVVFNVKSLNICLEVLEEHNIGWFRGATVFYRDRAGDCQGKNLGMAGLKQDKRWSHARVKRAVSILASRFSALKP